jgi:bacterioferritin
MGTAGRKIVGKDADKIIAMLNKLYCDEWLAYYQYWLGAKLVKGPMKDSVMAELTQHAADELRHAGMDADRIIQLGGTPALSPDVWLKLTNCGYDAPKDPYVSVILDQNIGGEQCAIKHYNELLKFSKDRDPVTYNMVLQILQDEVMHEEDLQNLKEDMVLMVKRGLK